jgi:hypothetical protein
MKIYINSTLIGLLTLCALHAKGQTTVALEVTGLTQVNDKLEVFFDLSNAAPGEHFRVWALVFKANGEQIPVERATGAIGDEVMGGMGRKIDIYLPEEYATLTIPLYVQVFARSNLSVRAPYFTRERTQYLLKSAVLPGWGQSEVRPGKPVWLMGVATYAALGGSIYFNRRGHNRYQDYLDAESIGERNTYYRQAEDGKQLSELLAYGAGALWLGNMIWSLLDKIPDTNAGLTVAPVHSNRETGLALRFTF